jgi:predicted restriction endonuclease
MSKKTKAELKKLRTQFREGVFRRDKDKCVFCQKPAVDAHHITDRSLMPNDGYAIENGISLCGTHHMTAERFHITGGLWWFHGFSPADLYRKIGSSYELALKASRELK